MNLRPKLSTSALILYFGYSVLISGIFAQFDCPPPWLEYAATCYKFVPFPGTYQNNLQICSLDGATLVSVESSGENDFIVGQLSGLQRMGWSWMTSGNRVSSTDTFMWQGDGTTVAGQQYWLPIDNVRDVANGNRIVYQTYDGVSWGWALAKDAAVLPFICEIPRSQAYTILTQSRDFGYGLPLTDAASYPRGPSFTQQPTTFVYDPASVQTYAFLKAVADANPPASYMWYYQSLSNPLPINPTSDARYTIISGELMISSPDSTKDSGNYQCVATNRYGSILSNTVQIQFAYLLDFPKTLRDPVSAMAYAGVGLECYPPKYGYSSVLFSWYKDSFMNFIRPALKPYAFISSNGKLYFSFVTKDDNGNYYCLVSPPSAINALGQGKVSMPIPLIVTDGLANIREPEIVTGFPTVFPSSPLVGQDVRIECMAYGSSGGGSGTQLMYSWQRVDKNGPMPSNAVTSDQNRVLTIPNVQLMHAGSYQCTVQRLNGQSASNQVVVPVESLPFFTIPLPNQFVNEGQDLTWVCNAGGKPSPTFQWYLNATLLIISNMTSDRASRYTINSNVLTISAVAPADAGMYQCAASNTHGTQYSSAQLLVYSFSPTFAKYPLDPNQYATLNGNATILCQPEAAPAATITWLKDGGPLNPSTNPGDRVVQLPNGNLHITQIQQSDAGVYTCQAQNTKGQASSTGNLTVISSTTITNRPIDMVAQVNRTAFLHCEASYNPVLDLTYDWYHNGFKVLLVQIRTDGSSKVWIVRDPYYQLGTGINRGALYITQTQFFHAGQYLCVAMTATESVSYMATLQVVGPPSAPAGIYGAQVTASTIMLSWTPSSDNGQPTTSMIVEGYSFNTLMWSIVKIGVSGGELTNRLTQISGLSPWSSYQFRMRAVNAYGIGDPSAPSPIYTTLAAAPVVAPQNVGGGGGKVGVLTITWDAVPVSQQNGQNLGYIVSWKKSQIADEEWTTTTMQDSNAYSFTALVGQKNFYTLYDVMVQAMNSEGVGPRSPIVTIRSSEDLPIAVPTDVRAIYFNSTALQVEWIPIVDTIDNMRGVLKGYRINYWRMNLELETQAQFLIVPGQRSNGVIIGLYPNTFYQVTVQTVNTAGFGPKSQYFYQRTLRFSPLEAPQQVTVQPVNANSIYIKWRGVSTTVVEEPLTGYTVRYFPEGENIHVSTDVDAGRKTHFVLTGLDQNVLYNLRVFGYSRGGWGLQSSPTLQFILGTNCQAVQDSPDKQYVFMCNSSRDRMKPSYWLTAAILLLTTRYIARVLPL